MSAGPTMFRLYRLPEPEVFDWQAVEDGPLTDLDVELILSVLDEHPATPVRDAGRKLRRFLAEVRD